LTPTVNGSHFAPYAPFAGFQISVSGTTPPNSFFCSSVIPAAPSHPVFDWPMKI
jgi:hypothetical protein